MLEKLKAYHIIDKAPEECEPVKHVVANGEWRKQPGDYRKYLCLRAANKIMTKRGINICIARGFTHRPALTLANMWYSAR